MHPDDGRVISNFIVQALKNKDITIYGDGSQTRSFCYVDDLVEGMVRFMNTEEKFIGPMNLGNPNEFTILELAKMILELTNSNSRIVLRALPEDDPKQRKPDISLAKKEINWSPSVNLESGLVRTIKFFRDLEIS
jgi:UDP-glucuronate decarboxylase